MPSMKNPPRQAFWDPLTFPNPVFIFLANSALFPILFKPILPLSLFFKKNLAFLKKGVAILKNSDIINLVLQKEEQLVLITVRVHPFPFRTRKLSSLVPKILGWRRPGKIGKCQHQSSHPVGWLFFILSETIRFS